MAENVHKMGTFSTRLQCAFTILLTEGGEKVAKAKDTMDTGPRGGTTTIRGDHFRKNFWINGEEQNALRRKAFEERRTETDIFRTALRKALGLKKLPDRSTG